MDSKSASYPKRKLSLFFPHVFHDVAGLVWHGDEINDPDAIRLHVNGFYGLLWWWDRFDVIKTQKETVFDSS